MFPIIIESDKYACYWCKQTPYTIYEFKNGLIGGCPKCGLCMCQPRSIQEDKEWNEHVEKETGKKS